MHTLVVRFTHSSELQEDWTSEHTFVGATLQEAIQAMLDVQSDSCQAFEVVSVK